MDLVCCGISELSGFRQDANPLDIVRANVGAILNAEIARRAKKYTLAEQSKLREQGYYYSFMEGHINGAGLILCSTNNNQTKAAQVLTERGFKLLYTFKNPRTNNIVKLWGVEPKKFVAKQKAAKKRKAAR